MLLCLIRRATALAPACVGLLVAAEPASAACFELVGCTDNQYLSTSALNRLSCDSLWTVRNAIFYENGYCFQTAKGRATFSNDGCVYTTSAEVPLNEYEQTNVGRVRSVERGKGCH